MTATHTALGLHATRAERAIEDIERHANECRNALTNDLVGYFIPIDQWRAVRSMLRTSEPDLGLHATCHGNGCPTCAGTGLDPQQVAAMEAACEQEVGR